MENMTSTASLKTAIQQLEDEQNLQLQQMKEQFYTAYKGLKTVNLFKSTVKDITSSPHLIENIIGTILSLGTGYLSKRIVVGASVSSVRRLLGAVMQFGVTHFVARHAKTIKLLGRHLLTYVFHKKEPVSS
ncbi:MAG: hypothetical protein JW830_13540 [Bacteroidales bacterium]|nr:hypothetical protein [Bacteroidales bacterium]